MTKKPQDLERAKVLDCCERLEKFKYEAQQKMYGIVRQQQMPPEMINTIILFEKDRADDQFFVDTEGLEEEDIDHNVKRLELEKDDEYKKIAEQWKKKSEDFLAARQKEAQAAMQKYRQQMAKQK